MNKVSTKPYPRSYWVEDGQFLAGYTPANTDPAKMAANLKALLNCGIRVIINLMEADETNYEGVTFEPYEPLLMELAADSGLSVSYHNLPIRDRNIPTRDLMARILNLIDISIVEQKPVYVHCWGGKGRTGTVVGSWLIDTGKAQPGGVLERIRELRKDDAKGHEDSPETPEQIQFVLNWRSSD